jgi:hypothetical protein
MVALAKAVAAKRQARQATARQTEPKGPAVQVAHGKDEDVDEMDFDDTELEELYDSLQHTSGAKDASASICITSREGALSMSRRGALWLGDVTRRGTLADFLQQKALSCDTLIFFLDQKHVTEKSSFEYRVFVDRFVGNLGGVGKRRVDMYLGKQWDQGEGWAEWPCKDLPRLHGLAKASAYGQAPLHPLLVCTLKRL